VITLITQVKTVEHSYCLSFACYLIEMLIKGLRGTMRHLIVVSCALFLVSCSAVYIFFKASAPHVRGLVGGGFFLLTSLLFLGKDFVPSTIAKKAPRTFQVGA